MHKKEYNSVEFIYCGCGCGKTRSKYSLDKKNNRPEYSKGIKKYYSNHYWVGKHSGRYKGGWIDKDGYRRIFINGKVGVLEHRYIWEQYYHEKLARDIDIHHKDGNKLNNDITNLYKVEHKVHVHQFHNNKVNRIDRECLTCGDNETTLNNKRCPLWYHYKDGFRCHKCYMKEISRNHRRKISSYKSVIGNIVPLTKFFSNTSKK